MKKAAGAKVTGAVVALSMCLNSVPTMALAENENPQGEIQTVAETGAQAEETNAENGAQAEETNAENGAQAEEGKPAEESKAEETQAEEIKEEKDAEMPSADENSAQAEESKEEINQPTEEETQPAAETQATPQTAQEGIAVQAELDETNAGAKVETANGETTYYATFAEILKDKLAGGSTITLLKDEGSAATGTIYINTEDEGITLDLNGKSLGYTSLYVGNLQGGSGGNSGKVTVVSEKGNNHLTIAVGTGGTLIFAPASTGTTGNISSCGGEITLSGGSVTIGSVGGTNIPITELLADGYAYKDEKGNWVEYSAVKNWYKTGEPYYVLSVVPCDHSDTVTDDFTGKSNCTYCNMEIPFRMLKEPNQNQLNGLVYGKIESGWMLFSFSVSGVTVNYKIDNGAEKSKTLHSTQDISIATEENLWNLPVGTHTLTLSAEYGGYTMPSKTYTFTVSKSGSTIQITNYTASAKYSDSSFISIYGTVTPTGTAVSTNSISTYSSDSTPNSVEVYCGETKVGSSPVSSGGNFSVFVIGSAIGAGDKTLIIKYIGNDNMADAETSINVKVEKLTPVVSNWRNYPYEHTIYDGTAVGNPTGLNIDYDGKTDYPYNNYKFEDIDFKYYAAEKKADGTYEKTSTTPLASNPVNAGDYIIEAVFKDTEKTNATTSELGFTINPAEGYNDTAPTFNKTVFISGVERTYEIDLRELLKDVPGITENDNIEEYVGYVPGITLNAGCFKDVKIENGKLIFTAISLKGMADSTPIGSIKLNLKTTNYKILSTDIYFKAVSMPEGTIDSNDITMENWTYGEEGKTPKLTVAAEGFIQNTYAVSYAKKDGTALNGVPTDAGEYIVTVSYETNDSLYQGTKAFTIYPKSIANATVTLKENSLVYNSESQFPEVESVVLDGKTLTPGRDADYGYGGNMEINVGEYTCIVKGSNNYTGEVEVPWSITPKPVTAALEITDADTYTYKGSEIKPTIVAKDGETVIPESEYMVSYDSNTNAGTASIIVTDKEGGNYIVNGGTTFTIKQAKVTIKALDKTMRKGKDAPDLSNPVAGTDYEVTGLLGDDVLGGTAMT